MKSISLVISAILIVGCTHYHKVESPNGKDEISEGFRVGIGSKEVKEGDTVNVFKPICKKVRVTSRGSKSTKCYDKEVGFAIVLRTLDEESAIVAPQNGLVMDSSMKVEKQRKGRE